MKRKIIGASGGKPVYADQYSDSEPRDQSGRWTSGGGGGGGREGRSTGDGADLKVGLRTLDQHLIDAGVMEPTMPKRDLHSALRQALPHLSKGARDVIISTWMHRRGW